MSEIRIYHKAGPSPIRPDKGTIAAVRQSVEGKGVRVTRPELSDLFIPRRGGSLSAFDKLPALPASVIDNPFLRMTEHSEAGWTVPVTCLGRKGEATPSQAQSILLWIKKNLSAVVDASSVAVTVE